jgi:hypothetical protein
VRVICGPGKHKTTTQAQRYVTASIAACTCPNTGWYMQPARTSPVSIGCKRRTTRVMLAAVRTSGPSTASEAPQFVSTSTTLARALVTFTNAGTPAAHALSMLGAHPHGSDSSMVTVSVLKPCRDRGRGNCWMVVVSPTQGGLKSSVAQHNTDNTQVDITVSKRTRLPHNGAATSSLRGVPGVHESGHTAHVIGAIWAQEESQCDDTYRGAQPLVGAKGCESGHSHRCQAAAHQDPGPANQCCLDPCPSAVPGLP